MSSTHRNRGVDFTNLTTKQKATIYGGALLFIIIGGLGISTWLWIGPALGWWGATVVPVTPTPTTTLEADEVSFEVYWYHDRAEAVDSADHGIGLYGVDVSLMTDAEIEDLLASDYTLKATYDHGDTVQLNEDYRYYAKLSGADICTDYTVVIPQTEYVFYAVNLTEDVFETCYSTDEGSVTINQTNYDEWTILVTTLDGVEGTGAVTDAEGFQPFIPETNSIFEGLGNYTVIRIDTNVTTTSATYFSYLSYDADYIIEVPGAAGYVYFCTPRLLIGEQRFVIKASAALGTTFEMIGIAIGYGSADSFTAWDSQN